MRNHDADGMPSRPPHKCQDCEPRPMTKTEVVETLRDIMHDIDYKHEVYCGEEVCQLCHAYNIAEKAIARLEAL